MTVTAPVLPMAGGAVTSGPDPGPAIRGPRVTEGNEMTAGAVTVAIVVTTAGAVVTGGVMTAEAAVTRAATTARAVTTAGAASRGGVIAVTTTGAAIAVPGRSATPPTPRLGCRRKPPTGNWTPRPSAT